MNFKIIQCDDELILPLRLKILRNKNSQIDKARYPSDKLKTTFHFAAVESHGQKALGALTLEKDLHPQLKSNFQYRLRGMAVETFLQQKGLGRSLVEHAESFLIKSTNCDLLWFNAREVAFPFYQKLGYHFFGGIFDIPEIGPHKVMYKALRNR